MRKLLAALAIILAITGVAFLLGAMYTSVGGQIFPTQPYWSGDAR